MSGGGLLNTEEMQPDDTQVMVAVRSVMVAVVVNRMGGISHIL